MTKIVLENKKYVILPEEDFLLLQRKAALKSIPEETLSLK
jgi:hypothetical protein